MHEYTLKVSEQDAGKRLDLFLIEFTKHKDLGFSRTFIQQLISGGKVLLDGSLPVKPHHKIKEADTYKVIIEDKKEPVLGSEDIPLEVVYEDDDLAVINKAGGIVVHPAPGNYEHTLVNALMHRFKKLSDVDPKRPGIVHRLDKETSGLLIIAKNNFTHHALVKQFSEHTIKRQYIALVKGRMEFDEHVIELPIGRHPHNRKNMAVGFSEKAKYAKTFYRTLKRCENFSLLELEPFTGRTHQLRVHLAYIKHPILGDTKYGKNNEFCRMALHAKVIGFVHPRTGKFLEFTSDIPKEIKDYIKI